MLKLYLGESQDHSHYYSFTTKLLKTVTCKIFIIMSHDYKSTVSPTHQIQRLALTLEISCLLVQGVYHKIIGDIKYK